MSYHIGHGIPNIRLIDCCRIPMPILTINLKDIPRIRRVINSLQHPILPIMDTQMPLSCKRPDPRTAVGPVTQLTPVTHIQARIMYPLLPTHRPRPTVTATPSLATLLSARATPRLNTSLPAMAINTPQPQRPDSQFPRPPKPSTSQSSTHPLHLLPPKNNTKAHIPLPQIPLPHLHLQKRPLRLRLPRLHSLIRPPLRPRPPYESPFPP